MRWLSVGINSALGPAQNISVKHIQHCTHFLSHSFSFRLGLDWYLLLVSQVTI